MWRTYRLKMEASYNVEKKIVSNKSPRYHAFQLSKTGIIDHKKAQRYVE